MFAISQDLMFWLGSWLAAHPERFSSLAIWKGCRFYCSLRRWWWASRHSVCIEYRVRGSGVRPLLDTHYTPAEYISSTTKCIIIIFSHFCFWIVHPCLTLINIAVFTLYCQVAMIVNCLKCLHVHKSCVCQKMSNKCLKRSTSSFKIVIFFWEYASA